MSPPAVGLLLVLVTAGSEPATCRARQSPPESAAAAAAPGPRRRLLRLSAAPAADSEPKALAWSQLQPGTPGQAPELGLGAFVYSSRHGLGQPGPLAARSTWIQYTFVIAPNSLFLLSRHISFLIKTFSYNCSISRFFNLYAFRPLNNCVNP